MCLAGEEGERARSGQAEEVDRIDEGEEERGDRTQGEERHADEATRVRGHEHGQVGEDQAGRELWYSGSKGEWWQATAASHIRAERTEERMVQHGEGDDEEEPYTEPAAWGLW